MGEVRTILERGLGGVTQPPDPFERMLRRRDRKRRNQRIAAGVIGIGVFVGVIVFATTGGPFDRSETALTPGGAGTGPTGFPEPRVAPGTDAIVGLPLEGAAPSQPKRGQLILHVGGGPGGQWLEVYVYADGRVIWGGAEGARGPTEGATGFVEQHLTPEGVAYLQDQVLSTGLFEHDLALLIDRTGFLGIEARNGDRLVQATWAWEGIVGKDAPSATEEQVNAFEDIYALFASPESWPASVWQDQDPETYVPSRYQVWLRVFPDQGDGPPGRVGEGEVDLLPVAVVDILRNGTEVRHAFYEVTTDDIRALADAFTEAGLEPSPMGEPVLRYELEDPYEKPGNSLYVFVGPVLPHGEVVFLGPG